ncbi:hypothetical protein [Aidingimonas halophila]|uniref:CHAP domain-containing protein n=1 Tax=Aidingimonas halophila TaxID=574349 RepID=A0A1H2RBW0_9GAMM|nr:hypothetical protein [Aidingimonas halophila]GHC19538.1 hypothetical protein GCM10008094_06980 [Aidingimonas halophila]SDW16640.1 hypothetical protein SAMN05443545_101274 [Aidingimonas halophila]
MLQPYLDSAYLDGGRGDVVSGQRQYDCYGLTRAIRHEVYGLPLLPSYGGISADDKRGLTEACRHEAGAFTPGKKWSPGAIATVWKKHGDEPLCTHVAVCVDLDGRRGVLETSASTGPRWLSVAAFERQYLTIIYYA